MYQIRIRTFITTLSYQLVWLVSILMIARYFMLVNFTEPAQLTSNSADVTRMWLTGLRYDLRIAGMLLIPFAVVGLLFAISRPTWQLLVRFTPSLFGVIAFFVAVVAISNFYYYQTYHNHIDVFAFGLAEDTTNVLANMWQDYPVIRGLALAILCAAIPARLAKTSLQDKPLKPWRVGVFIIYVLIVLTVVSIAARGSVSTFPLRRSNSQISNLIVLNKLTPNGLMAINWAIKDHNADTAFQAVTQEKGDSLIANSGLNSLKSRTTVNPWLAKHQPNVVMVLMESFGNNMLTFDQPGKNDLLGSLRPHFKEDFVFKRFVSEGNATAPSLAAKRFVSEGNATAPSLAAMFFHSPVPNISHSSAQKIKLSGTPFAVYKQAGYKIVFISSGNMMWRNLVNYLHVQGVDSVYDQNTLIDLYPESAAELTDWGVPDDYAYRLAETLLKETKEPLFISILTITNHPPYVTPARYEAAPVTITAALAKHEVDGDIAQKNILETYQFAADAFGQFMANIKNLPVGEKTLVAASEDHKMRRLNAFYPKEQMLDHAVPFYLYVPKEILKHSAWKFDKNRVGSHKDIFPTLYCYSLSNTEYQALAGRNMLAVTDDKRRDFGYNTSLWIDKKGAYPLSGNPVFYPWENSTSLLVSSAASTADKVQQTRQQAFIELLRWQLNARVKGIISPAK